ncbi:hypothetical protein ACJRO7_027185 [Eucalyptus globulus]|uniref:Uncharacterized protein n=1 Tax=Eucalyptus globulus TaxID=34317 RepID=A0ABD3JQB6_EUCGL
MARQKAMLNSRSQGIEKKWVCILLVLVSASVASSQYIVETLPGFPGRLPFKLETGYISVGEVEFFYYFVQSTGNPGADPLLFFMNGGPGCSGLNAFLFQIGPLKFNITDYTGGLPSLIYEPDAWTKTANIIFIDAPVGAGFSYATIASAYNSTDTLNTAQMQTFLRNWLVAHPNFETNPVFIGSDSYAGIYNPMLATAILQGNKAGLKPYVHLKGMILSCPKTDSHLEANSKIPFAYRLALISDALYRALEMDCGGEFVDVTNANCTEDLAAYDELVELINKKNVLDPDCAHLSPKSKEAFKLAISNQEKHSRSLQEFTKDYLVSLPRPHDLWCRVSLSLSLSLYLSIYLSIYLSMFSNSFIECDRILNIYLSLYGVIIQACKMLFMFDQELLANFSGVISPWPTLKMSTMFSIIIRISLVWACKF